MVHARSDHCLGIHALRVVFARPHREPEQMLNDGGLSLHLPASGGENEEAVIGKLVRMLCSQDYPDERMKSG